MSSLINRAPLDRFSGRPDLVRHLIQIYLDIAPGLIEKINVGIASGDIGQVARDAHSLKGSSSELGAEHLAQLCQQLQTAAKAGDRGLLATLAGELEKCYSETTAALKALDIH